MKCFPSSFQIFEFRFCLGVVGVPYAESRIVKAISVVRRNYYLPSEMASFPKSYFSLLYVTLPLLLFSF